MNGYFCVVSIFKNNLHVRQGTVKYHIVKNSDSHAISYGHEKNRFQTCSKLQSHYVCNVTKLKSNIQK
jgi:hypothetical protein